MHGEKKTVVSRWSLNWKALATFKFFLSDVPLELGNIMSFLLSSPLKSAQVF